MDIFRYKTPPSRWISSGLLGTIRLRPISSHKIQLAKQSARDWFSSHVPGGEYDQALFDLELSVRTLSKAAEIEPANLRQLDPVEINDLFSDWLELQSDSLPDVIALTKWIKRGIYLDAEIINEAIIASEVETAPEFYGLPLPELTTGQVLFFRLLRNLYLEKCEDRINHPNKMISKKVLEEQCK